MRRESLLEVDPPFEVVRDEELLGFGFAGERVSIEVSTRHEDEFTREHTLLTKPHMDLLEGVADVDAAVDCLLCNAGELSAEIRQLRVNCRLDIGVESGLDSARFDVEQNDRELDDLLRLQLYGGVVRAGALEVENADVVERRL
eukprot:CAMPEP_0170462982 /NCGR_PEP_ID=MMETSP0123-20130129/8268_1 /TAXON_ID=182087 /ORGANISM="Favella ehrenbergii, Strain Fehren 1" /LENGTH=143 /DNA_ID=CAMNT_0010728307 /DNA_START=449 /DNA_END=880 /DNA_ORIENTATION=+